MGFTEIKMISDKKIAHYSFKYEGWVHLRSGGFHSNHNCANNVLNIKDYS